MQERLHDCRAGELTQPLQPILPQAQITKVPHGTTATLANLGAKTYTQAEGSKLRREPKRGRKKNRPYCTLPTVQRQVFSHLLTCLPMPMPAPALDTVSTTRTAQLSDRPYRNSQQLPIWHQRPGLPLWLSEMPRGEGSTQGRSEASCCSGREVPLARRSAPARTFTTVGRHL